MTHLRGVVNDTLIGHLEVFYIDPLGQAFAAEGRGRLLNWQGRLVPTGAKTKRRREVGDF